jgi:hypothetical protein
MMKTGTRTMGRIIVMAAVAALVAACGAPRETPDAQTETAQPLVAPLPDSPTLSTAARATMERLQAAATAGDDAALVAIAAESPSFQYAFVESGDFAGHLAAARARGENPTAQLAAIMALPYANQTIGDTPAVVWPYIQTLDATQYSDRVRADAATIVGTEAATAMNAEDGYSGPRAAVDQNGHWLYFVLGETAS